MKKSLSFALIFAICAVMLLTNLNKVHAATTWNVYNPYSGFDHSNASDSRSIAYALANASTYDTVKIVEGELYHISQPLHVKNAITLRGILPTGGQKIVPTSNFPSSTPMIWMYSGASNTYPTSIKNLHIDGSWIAWGIIRGYNQRYLKVEDCILRNTKYNHTSGYPYLALLYFYKSRNIVIRDCEIKYAGYHPTYGRVGTSWTGRAEGIWANTCVGVTIDNCDIHHVLTAGIDFSNSRNVWVANSDIDNTGLNYDYGKPCADGITAYHNTLLSGYSDYNVNVYGNTVTNSHNHGIHLSGKGILIRNNTIDTVMGQGILLYDQYGTDGSENCTIKNNTITNVLHPELNGHAVYIRFYKIGTITEYGNGSDVVWYEGYN